GRINARSHGNSAEAITVLTVTLRSRRLRARKVFGIAPIVQEWRVVRIDFVTVEIAAALARKIRVIPVAAGNELSHGAPGRIRTSDPQIRSKVLPRAMK